MISFTIVLPYIIGSLIIILFSLIFHSLSKKYEQIWLDIISYLCLFGWIIYIMPCLSLLVGGLSL